MIGNNVKLNVKKTELEKKFPCYCFSSTPHVADNLMWALYKLDTPDFHIVTKRGYADAFLIRLVDEDCRQRYCCITTGSIAFGKVIPDDIARQYDGHADVCIRKPIEGEEERISYDTTLIVRKGVDYEYRACILRDGLERMIQKVENREK